MDFLITKLANSTDCSQRRIIAYWVTTVIIAAEFAVGGVMDILRLPPFPRLKEWAYAGMFFNMTGAAASHLAVGDPAVTLVAPIIFTGLVITSWALRPLARRDDFTGSAVSSRSRTIAYWVSTVLLALECGVEE
jgi:heme/copper-type cytochrome/quinol oxidase subunit 3